MGKSSTKSNDSQFKGVRTVWKSVFVFILKLERVLKHFSFRKTDLWQTRKGNRKAGDDYIVDGTIVGLRNQNILMNFCTLVIIFLRITVQENNRKDFPSGLVTLNTWAYTSFKYIFQTLQTLQAWFYLFILYLSDILSDLMTLTQSLRSSFDITFFLFFLVFFPRMLVAPHDFN